MKQSSLSSLNASLNDVTAAEMMQSNCVKGSQKLSMCLLILMYSLMYRCKDRGFLSSSHEIQEVEDLLFKVQSHYADIATEISKARARSPFSVRVNDFVENKLKKLIPQVIEYLKKKGTNSNIMADINALDVEGDKD